MTMIMVNHFHQFTRWLVVLQITTKTRPESRTSLRSDKSDRPSSRWLSEIKNSSSLPSTSAANQPTNQLQARAPFPSHNYDVVAQAREIQAAGVGDSGIRAAERSFWRGSRCRVMIPITMRSSDSQIQFTLKSGSAVNKFSGVMSEVETSSSRLRRGAKVIFLNFNTDRQWLLWLKISGENLLKNQLPSDYD